MKKILLSLFYIYVFSVSLIANPVGKEKAMEIARNFLGQMSPHKMNMVECPINKAHRRGYNHDDVPYYIINNEDGGFVIVSNSTSTVPILAYSYQNSFDPESVPDNLNEWMEQMSEIINKEWDREPTPEIAQVWSKYASQRVNSATPVVQLETAQWHQGSPFKDQCPIIDEWRCAAGCVPIALAITMRYWNWPNAGVGVLPKYAYNSAEGYGCEYDPSYEGVEGMYIGGGYELGEEYDWDSMPLHGNIEQFSDEEQYAVSHLVKDCGALLETVYSPGASGSAFPRVERIKKYFNYDKAFIVQESDDYSYNEWIALLKKELNEGRPLLTAGGFHAYVIDGYDNNDYFSINWGWGGIDNGYYVMGPFGAGYNGGDLYTNFIGQAVCIGLQPDRGNDYKYVLEWGEGYYLTIKGGNYELSKPFELSNVWARIRNSEDGDYFYRGDYAAAILNQSGEIKQLISTPQKLYDNYIMDFWFSGAHFCNTNTITCQIDDEPDIGDYIAIVFRSVGSSTWESVMTDANRCSAKLFLNESDRLDENTTITINPNERAFNWGFVSLTTRLMTIKTMIGTQLTIYRSDGSVVEETEPDSGWLHISTDDGKKESVYIHYVFLSVFEPGTYTIVLNHSLQHKEISFTL